MDDRCLPPDHDCDKLVVGPDMLAYVMVGASSEDRNAAAIGALSAALASNATRGDPDRGACL